MCDCRAAHLMTNYSEKATELLAQLKEQQREMAPEVDQVHAEAEHLLDAARKVGESWSGSNLGYHGELYYGDFEKPPFGQRFSVEWGGLNGIPPGWKSRTPEEVKDRIERLAGFQVEKIESGSKRLLDRAKKLQTEFLIELSPLHNTNGFKKEKELLSDVENLDWGEKAHNKYAADALNSFPNATRDREAIMAGRVFPAHTFYEAVAVQALASSDAVHRFWQLADRLLRQIQAQMSQIPTPTPAAASIAKVEEKYVNVERTKRVFLVHGRAEAAQQKVARFLEKLKLDVVILSEQPNKGRTIIEKFEQHSNVGYAVALLTPDDKGQLADEETPKFRARQNVILEFGYFIGTLGRSKVCALYVDGVELPSDLHGIAYVSLDPDAGWKLKLATEMKAAGMNIDLNNAVE
jgi:predicted nucleotide-binding protein